MTIDFSQSGKMVIDRSLESLNVKQNKLDATAAPTVDDDSGDGYAVGSLWLDVTNHKLYACDDATAGSASWIDLTASGAVTSVFGRTAAVVASSGDYTASQVTNAFDKTADDSDDISEGSTNLFMTSSEQSKLSGIESGADVTDATNVAAAGAVMDGDFTATDGFMRKTGAGAYEAIKANMAASTAPTTGDDSGDGYAVGSRWFDTTADKEYVCLDASSGAAVWVETTGGGTGSSPLTTKGDVYTYSMADDRLAVGTNGQILSSDSVETTGLKWIDQTIQNVSATSISATGNVNTFDPTSDGAVWYEFMVTDGSTNMAALTMMAVWDDSAGTVQYAQTKSDDIGDTSGITFSVDMDSGLVRLRATVTTGTWNVYGYRRIRYAA